jgi:hypothetical protein
LEEVAGECETGQAGERRFGIEEAHADVVDAFGVDIFESSTTPRPVCGL